MNRRQFLATTASALVDAVAPVRLAAAPFISGDWSFDHATKLISYIGKKPISVMDMHLALREVFARDEMFLEPPASIKITNQYIVFDGPWKMTDASLGKVIGGSVANGKDHWQGLTILGNSEADYTILRDGSRIGLDQNSAHRIPEINSDYFTIKCRGDEKHFAITGSGHNKYDWFSGEITKGSLHMPMPANRI